MIEVFIIVTKERVKK